MYTASTDTVDLKWTQEELVSTLTAIARCDRHRYEVIQDDLSGRPQRGEVGNFEHSSALLNQLRPQVMDSKNARFVNLFQRAVRNHNVLSTGPQCDPVTLHRKYDLDPDYQILNHDLTLDVKADHVLVTSKLELSRQSEHPVLVLDGKGHEVQRVRVNGFPLHRDDYRVTDLELILLNPPEDPYFTVEVESKINPYVNSSGTGLYKTGDSLMTQCESEGARQIFYTIDRPCVLSSYSTTIIADDEQYPRRLAN